MFMDRDDILNLYVVTTCRCRRRPGRVRAVSPTSHRSKGVVVVLGAAAACQSMTSVGYSRPGVDRRYLRDTLRSVHTDVSNLWTGGTPGGAYQRLLAYLQWADEAAGRLGTLVSGEDLDRLVFTKRYELLLDGMGIMTRDDTAVQRVVNGMVRTQLQERVTAFESAVAALEEQISRWSGLGQFIMPDTSFYIQHDAKLEDADFSEPSGPRSADHRVGADRHCG